MMGSDPFSSDRVGDNKAWAYDLGIIHVPGKGFLKAPRINQDHLTAGPWDFCLYLAFLAQDFWFTCTCPSKCSYSGSLVTREMRMLLLTNTLISPEAVTVHTPAFKAAGSSSLSTSAEQFWDAGDFWVLIKLSPPGHQGNACCLFYLGLFSLHKDRNQTLRNEKMVQEWYSNQSNPFQSRSGCL